MPRALTPSEAASLLRTRDQLGLPLGPGQPATFLHALAERDDFEELAVYSALMSDLFAVLARPGVRLVSGFFGPAERALAAAGHDVRFLPADFRRFGPLLEQLAPRVMATCVAPAGADGRYSLSLHAGATVAELRRCGRDPGRVLIAEVNPKLPRTWGLPPEHPHSLAPDEIDFVIAAERDPLELPEAPPSEVDERIAGHAMDFLPDGATLQTGIGGIPNAVAALLAAGPGGDYGIHTEMFTDGLMHLHRAGKVSNRKGLHDGYSVATFALGTRALYDWLDGCDAVRFLPVEAINDPGVIARNRCMRSINGALAVDLYGQVAADVVGGQQYSGIGGHEDFMAGAGVPLAGHSLVCLPTTSSVDGRAVSRILARLEPGMLVTTPRHQLDVVVTEFGAADVRGLAVEERARALLAVAHPDFRDELREAWERQQRGA